VIEKENTQKWSSVSIRPVKNSGTDLVKEKSFKIRKPKWLKVKLPTGQAYKSVREITKSKNLHTICESGNCPNMGECWGAGTATFMILGNICTRSCGFCNVMTGRPLEVDILEPLKVARSVKLMKVKHAVITSVDRDDLRDGGASIWVETIHAIRKLNPTTTMETLIPDFKGKEKHIQKIIEAKPEVVSHNLETVRSLTKRVRIQAKYDTSLNTLQTLFKGGIRTKSGIMLGLGEKESEVIEAMKDLRNVGVKILTLGQYLQPSKKHLPVVEFITPEQFSYLKEVGLSLGFEHVESSPLVRSSYHAEKHI
jgi:lipoic acid synthetase|tara:strand:+ start:6569 stop:7498 length:930 start_codon:yes stop_codon:yes gene_type:complete